MKVSLLFLALILFACSCTTLDPCEEDTVSDLRAVFKILTDDQASDTIPNGTDVYMIREDQPVILYDTIWESEILLPLDPHHDISRFVFEFQGISDTLILKHSSEIYLISYSCGFGNQFTLDPDIQYGPGMFVKDSIINFTVNTTLEEEDVHIWLYF